MAEVPKESKKEAPQKPTEAKKEVPISIRRTIKSITSSTIINNVEYMLVPKGAFKYILLIPPTISCEQRQIGDTMFERFPVATDWDSSTEFYINGKEVPFEELEIQLILETRKDQFGNPIPNMPRVRIVG